MIEAISYYLMCHFLLKKIEVNEINYLAAVMNQLLRESSSFQDALCLGLKDNMWTSSY